MFGFAGKHRRVFFPRFAEALPLQHDLLIGGGRSYAAQVVAQDVVPLTAGASRIDPLAAHPDLVFLARRAGQVSDIATFRELIKTAPQFDNGAAVCDHQDRNR